MERRASREPALSEVEGSTRAPVAASPPGGDARLSTGKRIV